MKTYDKCLACFARQATDACAISGLDAHKTQEVLSAVEGLTRTFPRERPPVVMAVETHALIRRLAGNTDPYAELKSDVNRVCRECVPLLMKNMAWSLDPLKTAVQLAIAGNVMDFGVYSATRMTKRDVAHVVEEGLKQPLTGGLKEFTRILRDAERILYIADNAGECFFDSLLLDVLSPGRVTYAVRGGPILNDATREDAVAAGIHDKCRIIDTGDNAPGVLLDRCSDAFHQALVASSVVVAKGQGNYESLSTDINTPTIFLLKVKCDVIARDIGQPVGSNVVEIRTPRRSA